MLLKLDLNKLFRPVLFSEFYGISVVTVSFWRENSSEKSYDITVTAKGIEGGVGFNLSK